MAPACAPAFSSFGTKHEFTTADRCMLIRGISESIEALSTESEPLTSQTRVMWGEADMMCLCSVYCMMLISRHDVGQDSLLRFLVGSIVHESDGRRVNVDTS